MSSPSKAHAAFVKAFAEVQAVGKGGTMKEGSQRYTYQRYEDILPAVRSALAANGLAPIPVGFEVFPEEKRTTKGGALQYVVRIEATYRLYADDGSYVEGKGIGRGVDTGDKDISKAQTYAYKWFLTQTFQIAVQDSPDPDGTVVEETTETEAQRTLREHREQHAQNQPRPSAPTRSPVQQPATPPPASPPTGISELDTWKQRVVDAGVRAGFKLPDGQADVPALATAYKAWSGGSELRAATVPLLQRFVSNLEAKTRQGAAA